MILDLSRPKIEAGAWRKRGFFGGRIECIAWDRFALKVEGLHILRCRRPRLSAVFLVKSGIGFLLERSNLFLRHGERVSSVAGLQPILSLLGDGTVLGVLERLRLLLLTEVEIDAHRDSGRLLRDNQATVPVECGSLVLQVKVQIDTDWDLEGSCIALKHLVLSGDVVDVSWRWLAAKIDWRGLVCGG